MATKTFFLAKIVTGIAIVAMLVTSLAGCFEQGKNANSTIPNRSQKSSPSDEEDDGNFTVRAAWNPILESKYKFGERWETLKNLKVAIEEKTYLPEEHVAAARAQFELLNSK